MDVTASLATHADPSVLARVVSDLGTYPSWLDIVERAESVEEVAGDAGPAWSVDLRAQVGPFRRSKRLRMVRTACGAHRVRFERREPPGRDHSPWVLEAAVVEVDGGSELTMHLHYGGSLWAPLLDRLLSDEIERSRPRLVDHLRSVAGDGDSAGEEVGP